MGAFGGMFGGAGTEETKEKAGEGEYEVATEDDINTLARMLGG